MTVLRGAGPTGPDDRTAPGDGYDTSWLDLRARADSRARSTELLDRLAGPLGPESHLLDLGCGAGAMQRWCAERLDEPVRWTLLDPDPDLLAIATERATSAVSCVRGTVQQLDTAVLAEVDAVVCSALLDVLPTAQIEHLVTTLAGAGVPLLAALTVTGQVSLSPAHPDDERAAAAVARTATRDGAAGPAAVSLVHSATERLGLRIVERATPWLLQPAADGDLLRAWAAGYVAAAVAGSKQAPGSGPHDDLNDWAENRLALARHDALTVTVGHVDLLVLPG